MSTFLCRDLLYSTYQGINPSWLFDREDLNTAILIQEDTGLKYIATQGCLPETVDDFWRMVYFQDCHIILNVTRVVERQRVSVNTLSITICIAISGEDCSWPGLEEFYVCSFVVFSNSYLPTVQRALCFSSILENCCIIKQCALKSHKCFNFVNAGIMSLFCLYYRHVTYCVKK